MIIDLGVEHEPSPGERAERVLRRCRGGVDATGAEACAAIDERLVREALELLSQVGRCRDRVLFTVAMVHARWNRDARAYLDRKRAEGKSAAEARRCLKRHLAKVVYDAMRADAHEARLRAAA
ncbi:MAG: hypothetical protein ACLGI8_14900 [Acidimicrobiia bacterium]